MKNYLVIINDNRYYRSVTKLSFRGIRMDNQEPKHQRRVRYNGTHPKAFKEKYKELQPDKYAGDVAKVI